MANTYAVVLKDLRAEPEHVFNDGSAIVRVEVMVFTATDHARVQNVFLDLSAWGGSSRHFLHLDPQEGVRRTAEGMYRGTFGVPLLSDPGRYDLPVHAEDSEGGSGVSILHLEVDYRRPEYSPAILSRKNQAAMDRVSAAVVLGGNRVEVLTGGGASMHRRMSLIEGARKQINMEFYSLSAEGLCGRFVDAVLKKASEGVEVNLILNMSSQLVVSPLTALRVGLDKIGREIQVVGKRIEAVLEGRQGLLETLKEVQESFQGFGTGKHGVNVILAGEEAILGRGNRAGASGKRSQKWLEQMERDRQHIGKKDSKRMPEPLAGGMRNLDLPSLPLLTYAVHEKIMVVDGERAIVGGRNLEDRYFTHWYDLDLFLEGPIVRQIQEGFLRTWNAFCRNVRQEMVPAHISVEHKKAGTSDVRFVQSRPWLGEYTTMETLVTAFQMARERIRLSSQYLVLPESLLREALVDAARRGVDVQILTNSYTTGMEVGFSAGYCITLRYAEPLLDAGIRIFEMIGPEEAEMPKPYLHAKAFLVDGKWSAIGSFNLSMRSCFIESENLVCIQDPDLVRQQEAWFENTLRNRTSELTRERLQEQTEKLRTKMAVTNYLDLFF